MQSTSCEMLGWMNNKIKIAGRNINNLRYADDTTLMAESKEELKSLLIKVKEKNEKAGLQLNIQKAKTNLDNALKKQRYRFAYKGPSSQSHGVLVVMYGCDNWTIKKAECRRTGAFELWCWRRLLRVPWTARS